MNVDLSDLTRRFGRTQAVDVVSLQTGPGVFGLRLVIGAQPARTRRSTRRKCRRSRCTAIRRRAELRTYL
jgi:hypothetical protein